MRILWAYDGPLKAPYRHYDYDPDPTPVWFLRRGKVTLHFGSQKETYAAGQWIFPKREAGRQIFSSDVDLLSLRFVAEWPTGEELFDRSKTRTIAPERVPSFTRMTQRLVRHISTNFPGVTVELQGMSGSPQKYFQMQRLLYGWLIEYMEVMALFRLTPHTIEKLNDHVRQAIHELEARPLNQPLREQELGRQVNLSVSQLNKLFVRSLGKTPAEYWRERRIRSARLALQSSERSVKSIAYDLGFNSLPHFSAWVKKTFGKSPRQFRAPGG